MPSPVAGVRISAEALAQLLSLSVSQTLEQAVDLARLNLAVSTGAVEGGNREGVGELLDVLA